MRRIGEWVVGSTQWVSVVALTAMMFHLVADIALRNLANLPLEGTIEIVAKIYMPLVVFAALASTHFRKEEIRVELIAHSMPVYWLVRVDRVVQLFVAMASVGIAWLTTNYAIRAITIGERIEIGTFVLPSWPGKAMVTLGFALLALAAILRLLERAK